jgi:ApaG protein
MGIMSGHYFCVGVDGVRFEAPVPPFVLRADGAGLVH